MTPDEIAEIQEWLLILEARDLELPEFHAMQLKVAKATHVMLDRIAALEAELALRTRERDEWRREHDMVEGIAKRYQVALDHIGNNDDADCSLTERQRIRIAREAVRGAGYKD